MSRDQREAVADWMIVIGAVALFASLFLPWSHQFSKAFQLAFGRSIALQGLPRDPTAWQVYSAADVALALLAGALVVAAMLGNQTARLVVTGASAVALTFTVHALSVPPSNGATLFDPSLGVPNLYPNNPQSAVGATVALLALIVALIGLLLSFTAD